MPASSVTAPFSPQEKWGAVPVFSRDGEKVSSFFDPLQEHMPEKDRGGDEGSLPETAWFLEEPREPLQAVFQKPGTEPFFPQENGAQSRLSRPSRENMGAVPLFLLSGWNIGLPRTKRRIGAMMASIRGTPMATMGIRRAH